MKTLNPLTLLKNIFTSEQAAPVKAEKSDYLKAVYPLFGLIKRSKEQNKVKREQGFEPMTELRYVAEQMSGDDAALNLAIKSAVALSKLKKGYVIKPLPCGDFIATREDVSVYVRATPYIESLFCLDAERLTREDIDDIVEEKQKYNCSAAIYLSFGISSLEMKFYSKTKDIFGIDGLSLIGLLQEGGFVETPNQTTENRLVA